jgi:uncharacterized membrane protein (DUF4010 family)
LVSSTAVTWGFARSSRDEASLRPAYAAGVVAACTVLVPRVAVVTIALNRAVGFAVLPYLAAPFVAGAVCTWWAARSPGVTQGSADEHPRSPLRLGAALQMALAFQVVLLLMGLVRGQFGDAGVYTTAALFGTTDVDAITVTMTRMDQGGFATVAARAIVVAVTSNTLVKLMIAVAIGRGAFRSRVGLALALMLASLAASLLLLR